MISLYNISSEKKKIKIQYCFKKYRTQFVRKKVLNRSKAFKYLLMIGGFTALGPMIYVFNGSTAMYDYIWSFFNHF